MPATLLEMAKTLVLAQIEAKHVTAENLQTVLHSTYDALQQLQAMEAEEADHRTQELPEDTPAPDALDWKKTISKHAIICLECGESFKQLSRRHLKRHDLDSKAYRRKYDIPSDQALSARVVTARRRQLAKSIRPWEKARHPASPRHPNRSTRS